MTILNDQLIASLTAGGFDVEIRDRGHGVVDFTHEREWRVPGDLDLTKLGMYVIVWSTSEEKDLCEVFDPIGQERSLHHPDGEHRRDALTPSAFGWIDLLSGY
jgi:hypothetical protein